MCEESAHVEAFWVIIVSLPKHVWLSVGIAQSDLSREAAVAQADGFDDQSESGSHPKRFKSEQKLISAARLCFRSQSVPGSSCDFMSDVKHLSHALDITPGATFTLPGRREVGSGWKPKTDCFLSPPV